MQFQAEYLQLNAPLKLVFAGQRQRAVRQGTVLFYHGLGSSKEQQDKELYSLARAGFLAVGVDNVGHGARRYSDFDEQFSGENPHFGQALLGAVSETAQELPALLDGLTQNKLIDNDKIGLIGVSMGGYIAYASILNDKRIKAAAVILGSPHFWEAHFDSPHTHPERFFPVALLSQNAGQDTSVSPQFAREFHQTLTPYYASAPERLHYIEYPDSGHFMREADWELCWGRALRWLKTFLPKPICL